MTAILSDKEKEVAVLVANGLKDVEIAEELQISRRRVGEIISSIKRKWNKNSRVEIGIMVYRLGWLEEEVADWEMKKGELMLIRGGERVSPVTLVSAGRSTFRNLFSIA